MIQAPGRSPKHYTRLERLPKDKHSSIFAFVSSKQKLFCEYDPGPLL